MRTTTVRADRPLVNPLPFAAVPHALVLDRRLIGTDVRLAALLLRFGGGRDRCWPSVATLARELGCCERTVQYALRRLQRAGWLRSEAAGNPTGRVLVFCWLEGCKPPRAGGCKPYSQGLPIPRPGPVAPQQESGTKKAAPPRKSYEKATPAELGDLLGSWLDRGPDHPLRRLALRQLAGLTAPGR